MMRILFCALFSSPKNALRSEQDGRGLVLGEFYLRVCEYSLNGDNSAS
jgi:hypothetical protein